HDGVPRPAAHDEVRRSRSVAASAAVFAATYLPLLAGFGVLPGSQDHGVGKVLTLIALPDVVMWHLKSFAGARL
ncbi:Phosphatidate cytidylyltransferase, partial [human gut metagenome]